MKKSLKQLVWFFVFLYLMICTFGGFLWFAKTPLQMVLACLFFVPAIMLTPHLDALSDWLEK